MKVVSVFCVIVALTIAAAVSGRHSRLYSSVFFSKSAGFHISIYSDFVRIGRTMRSISVSAANRSRRNQVMSAQIPLAMELARHWRLTVTNNSISNNSNNTISTNSNTISTISSSGYSGNISNSSGYSGNIAAISGSDTSEYSAGTGGRIVHRSDGKLSEEKMAETRSTSNRDTNSNTKNSTKSNTKKIRKMSGDIYNAGNSYIDDIVFKLDKKRDAEVGIVVDIVGHQPNNTDKADNNSRNDNSSKTDTIQFLNSCSCDTRVIVILMGIPGSGKSTLAKRVISSINSTRGQDDNNNTIGKSYCRKTNSKWLSLNQDMLGSRKKVISATAAALQQKKNVIIDRCNFDEQQRLHWIELAQQFNVTNILGIVLPNYNDIDLCADRAYARGNDGIHDEDTNWLLVCRRMENEFVFPSLSEGFSHLYVCSNDKDLDELVDTVARNFAS